MTAINYQVYSVSVNQIPMDWSGNRSRIINAAREIAIADPLADLILFPELSLSGYGCEDAFHSLDLARRSYSSLNETATELKKVLPQTLVLIGLPVIRQDRIFNCMAAIYNGEVRGIVAKQNLAGDGVHYEPRWFSAWDGSYDADFIDPDGSPVPFGAMVFSIRGLKIGIEICEDSWVALRPALQYMMKGIDLLVNPSASHFALGKHKTRRDIAEESSRIFGAHFINVNLLGCEAGRMIYDGGSVVAAGGEILHQSERFSFRDAIITHSTINPSRNRVLRTRVFSLREQKNRFSGKDVPVIEIDEQPATGGESSVAFTGTAPAYYHFYSDPDIALFQSDSRDNEFFRAVILGLFDYMRKTKSRGYVISLSGGVDSGACTLLVQRMLFYASLELGIEKTLQRLGIMSILHGIDDEQREALLNPIDRKSFAESIRFIASRSLFTIYQKTANNSKLTQRAASDLSKALGTCHYEIAIDDAVDLFVKTMESATGRQLRWETDDLPLQNIQARTRSPLAWLLANMTGSILITTGNRSEAAAGYCTMDGDTSGGLAPIGGIDKAFLIRWLNFMRITGDPAAGPIPELDAITEQAPTAELRPIEKRQTDEADLMPYRILDIIERHAIRDRKSPGDVYSSLLNDLELVNEFGNGNLKTYVKRFFLFWSRNQWKRERYAPSFHIDDESLDPKSWYRFPILNSGYADELRELDELQ
jgi:NAD+ synthase (glutamine-hydrolysing)